MKKRAHIFITGRVQGVFYRSNTRSEAHIMGLTGWVRNCRDGRVEAVIEGEEELVKQLIDWCRRSPGLSNVEKIEVDWEEPTGEFKTFDITY